MSAIQADYRTNKHIPSRKCYQLILEVPEEQFPEVCSILGYPKTGENTYVGIALLDKAVCVKNAPTAEGERLRTRAIMLCKDEQFQDYAAKTWLTPNTIFPASAEEMAKCVIIDLCDIKSRSELATNRDAQEAFSVLLRNFREWKTSQDYADNLSRI